MFCKTAFLAALLCGPICAQAEGEKFAILKVGQNAYSNVTVMSVSATDIYFSHQGGMGNAKLKLLEPDLQKRFHFDSARALAKQTEQAQANALYANTVRLEPAPRPKTQAPDRRVETAPDSVVANGLAAKSFLNQPAPEIVAEKWVTDAPETKGKFILIEFWATWSEPCRAFIPLLNQLQEKFRDRLVVIGLSNESDAEIRNMAEPRIEYALACDPQHRSLTAVGVRSIPHSLLIDPQGIVRFEGHPGYLEQLNLAQAFETYGP
jgi:thiol-disulfide isomerase/thioredoxin